MNLLQEVESLFGHHPKAGTPAPTPVSTPEAARPLVSVVEAPTMTTPIPNPTSLMADLSAFAAVIQSSADNNVQALIANIKATEPLFKAALPALATLAANEIVADIPVVNAASGLIDPVIDPIVAGIATMAENALIGIVTAWFSKKAVALAGTPI